MRLLVISTTLAPGGAENALVRILTELTTQPKGIVPCVVSLSGLDVLGKKLVAMGIPVVALDMPAGRLTPRGLLRLARLVRSFRPDVIQGWMYHGNLLAHFARLCAPRRPALALAIRQSLTTFATSKRLARYVIRLDAVLSRWADKVFYVSRLAHQQHISLGYTNSRAHDIPNGFDTTVFAPSLAARTAVRQEFGLAEETLLVGLVARWHEVKNHAGFFAAAEHVLAQRPNVHFVCVGRGMSPDNVALLSCVPPRLLPRLHLLGERADVPSLTAALDVAVNASHAEAFPNAVGEAMACGVPCVVTDVGDSAWIVGDTGVVVPPEQVGALADGILQLLNASAEQRQQRGQAARTRVVSEFSLAHVAHQYWVAWTALAAVPTAAANKGQA